MLIQELARRIKQVLGDYNEVGACEGVGVAVPGMVDPARGWVLHAPTLSWRDVNLRDPLAIALGIPVHIENSGKACALAQLWATRSDVGNSIFVSVSRRAGRRSPAPAWRGGTGCGVRLHQWSLKSVGEAIFCNPWLKLFRWRS